MRLEISYGEAFDKCSILDIKKDFIKDTDKLIEINKEISSLNEVYNLINKHIFYYNLLIFVNRKLWNYTDIIKENKDFSIVKQITLYNLIFEYNQYRFRIKNLINLLYTSTLKEQKSYKKDIIEFTIDDIKDVYKVNKLLLLYDNLTIYCDDNLKYFITQIYYSFIDNIIFFTNENKQYNNINELTYFKDNVDENIFNFN